MKREFTKLLMLWLFTAVFAITGFSQSFVEIGTGTTGISNYPHYYYPLCNYYENNKTQMLYLQSELGSAQTFTSIGFDIERIASSNADLVDFTINFLHTSDASLTSGAYADMTGATEVFYSASYTLATATGWNSIDITDFAYNGTDNLIVEIIWGDLGAYASTYYRNYKTDGGVTRCLYGYADSETPPNYDGASNYYSNMRFYYTATTPVISVLPSTYDYGSVETGTCSSDQTFTLSNTGAGTITIASGGISLTGTDASEFTLTDGNSYPMTLPTDKTVDVKFCPTSDGAKTAFLTIVDDITKQTTNIPLDGTGFTPPANDLCGGAIELSVGTSCSYATYTTEGATASGELPAPTCGGYQGSDVWFWFTVPATGAVTINSNTGVITDGAMNAYSGTCGTLANIECNDDGSENGAMPMLELTGLTPSEVIYIRFWEYGGNNNGTFDICAFDPTPLVAPACTTPVSPLDAVTDVAVDGNLTWNTAADATGYYLYFGTDGGGITDPVSIVAGTDQGDVLTYAYSGLATSTVHYWKVVPWNAVGPASGCAIWSFTTAAPSYCASTFSNTTDDWITNVTFNTINNTTGQEGAGSYGDYTAQSTDIEQGTTVQLDVSFESGTYTDYVRAWIDWNQDYNFDTDEAFDLGSGASATVSTNILVPATATLGSTRMRIIEQYNSYPEPCNPSSTYGETEDYTVNITVATSPVLLVVPASLDFGSIASGNTSAEQSYALSGNNLTGFPDNITVTAPAGFEVSLTTAAGFGGSVLVPYTSATLAATTIYVRFHPTASATVYDGTITNVGGGTKASAVVDVIGSSPCEAFTATFSENFDGVTAPDLPICWSSIVNSTSSATVGTYTFSTPYSSPNHARLYNSNDAAATLLLITPQLSDLTSQSNQIRFYAKSGSTVCDLIVGTMSDPTDDATFTSFITISLTNTYTEYTVAFGPSYTAADEYIAFKHGLGGTYRYIYVDDFTWEEIPSCLPPTTQTETNITASGADLGWTDISGSHWDIYVVAAGGSAPIQNTSPTADDITANPYTYAAGSANTSYDWYVRSDCDEDNEGTSTWTGPSTFTTACASITSFPVTEDFENGGAIPNCWEDDPANSESWLYGTSAGYGATADHTTGSGYFAWIDDSSPHDADPSNLLSPIYNTTSLTAPQLVFYYWIGRGQSGSTLDVDVYDGTTWQTSQLTLAANNGWIAATLDLTAHTNANLQLRFLANEDVGDYLCDICIDDVTIEEAPSCLPPSNLTETNITTNGADLEWQYTPDSFFDIFVDVDEIGAPGPGTIPTASGIPGNSYTWTGGQAATEYDWYVRTDCGFETPDVDYFWMAMDNTGPGDLLLPFSGGTVDEPGETGVWWEYLDPDPDPDQPWWNVWFYNDPLDLTRMKKIKMGFWVQSFDGIAPGELFYVVNWSNDLWEGPGFPTPEFEVFIERSPTPAPTLIVPGVPQWIELSYIIEDYNPEWVSIDIWGQNIQILEVGDPPPADSPLFDYWVSPNAGGIIVHECLPKPLGNNSTWEGPGTFITGCLATTVPYTENFDGVTAPAFPVCMTVENTNGDSKLWETSTTHHSSPNSARIGYNGSLAMDDWFFTEGLSLTGGVAYELDFVYRAHNSSYPEKLAVDWGTSASSAGMSGIPIFDDNNISSADWLTGSGTFTPATTGIYYVGFHGYSDANQYYLYVDDIYVKEAPTTWTGTAKSNDWHTAGNWNYGVPRASNDAIIPASLATYPTIGAAAVCNNITLEDGATLMGQENLTVNGSAYVQKDIAGYTTNMDGWNCISAPVFGMAMAGSDFAPVAGEDELYAYDENINIWRNFHGGNPVSWFDVFDPLTGYLVGYLPANAGTKSFTGPLNVDEDYTIDLPITNTGWSVIGNPYPSKYAWDDVDRVQVSSPHYLDVSSGAWEPLPPNGNRDLAVGQGIFVKAESGAGTPGVTFDRAKQTHGSGAKDKSHGEFMKVLANFGDLSVHFWLVANEDASQAFEWEYDSRYLYPFTQIPYLSAICSDEVRASVYAFKPTDETTIVPLYFKVSEEQQIIFEIETFGKWARIDKVTLEDSYLNTFTVLSDGKAYSFDATPSDDESRFKLHLEGSTGIADNSTIRDLDIYTFDNNLYLDCNRVLNAEIRIYNITGQEMLHSKICIDGLQQIPLNLNTGWYMVSVISSEGISSRKVFVR